MTENTNRNFLLEVYVENIPARFITSALVQIKNLAADFLKFRNLPHGEISTFGTYRRLALFIENIPGKTVERSQIFYGPSSRLLKDENGEYTKQAKGFAASIGVSCEKLKTVVLEKKGEVLCYERKLPPSSALKILSEMCIHIIKNLQFPKNMIWEESKLRFARPIRNITAIYGSTPVTFRLAGVKSGKTTFGLAALGSKKISIKSADLYLKSLEKAQVIVKDEHRKQKIVNDLKNAGSAMKISVDIDEALVEENSYLTEYPSCVPVKYSNEFLSLPQELLSLVMKKQLKFFPCYRDSHLAPFFIGVRDGVSKGNKNVEEGFLNVFEARCRDAMFFYENDLKTPVSVMEERISKILFQEKLGTMKEKKERVKSISLWIAEKTACKSADLQQAASFAYLDLASNVVREFPELQGVMSGYYGKTWGIGETASLILKDFYKPSFSNDSLPSTIEGAILSLAARIDTLAGDFATGVNPTGSQDPHALRRTAYGVIRIIVEMGVRVNLRDAFLYALSLYKGIINLEKDDECWLKIADFFWQRLENYDSAKFPPATMPAVRSIFHREGDLLKIMARICALNDASHSREIYILASLHKRINNILKDKKTEKAIRKDLFEKEEEKQLVEALENISVDVLTALKKDDFKSAISSLVMFKLPLENFFAAVMVMCDNPEVMENRLSILSAIKNLFDSVADLSQLSLQPQNG